jgi:hypothetical protein
MLTQKNAILALVAGLVSAGLFLLILGLGLGFLFMFLPTLPLLMLGLGKEARLALAAMLVAALLIALVGGLQAALLFCCMLGIPAWYMTHQALLWREKAGAREWYSVGLIMTHLTLYACTFVALLGIYYAKDGGLSMLLADSIRTALAELKDGYSDIIEAMATRLSFLIFAITIWLWGMTLYAHGWLATRLLAHKKRAHRPDFTVTPFMIPGWMISLLLISALASLIGSTDMRFIGKSTLISLLLPYFFAGIAAMHAASRKWSSRGFFLFFIYFMTFALLWPALILAAIGFFHQIKGLSASGSSTKS